MFVCLKTAGWFSVNIINLLDSCDAFDNEVVASQRACLVETANVDLASERDSKRLGTVDADLDQRDERGVDRECQLDWQLGRNH